MAADIGDIFERQLQEVMDTLKESHLLQWHAFPDRKRSAGGAVATQPSDYLIGLPEGSRPDQRMIFFEAKASEKYDSLRKSMVRPGQRGVIHTWSGLLDLPYLIIFYSTTSRCLELWDGLCVTLPRINKESHRLAVLPEAGSGHLLDKEKVTDFLRGYFALPEKGVTVKAYERRNTSAS